MNFDDNEFIIKGRNIVKKLIKQQNMNNVTCKSEKKDIVIRIPKDLMVFILEEEDRIGYSRIKILNKRKFFKEFCESILDYNIREDGSTPFSDLIDNCVEELLNNGSESIEAVEEQEDLQ